MSLGALLILVSATSPVAGDGQTARPDPPKQSSKAEKSAAPAASPATASEASPEAQKDDHKQRSGVTEPPEGVTWQKDEKGNEFFVTAMPKEGLEFTRIDENSIRIRRGMPLELAGEDEENFYYKTFKTHARPRLGPPPPTPEELERTAESYRPKVGSADRLKLVPFDAGLPKQGFIWRNGFNIADMNGDGNLDILHGPPRKYLGPPFIFLGDGKGNWSRWKEASWQQIPWEYGDAAAADFNGDGKMDAAFGLHHRGVAAFIGDGQGKFTLWNQGIGIEQPGHKGEPAFSSREIDVADWNGDGRPDLVVYSEGPRGFQHVGLPNTSGKIIYLNQGDGTWNLLKKPRPSPLYGDALVVADFNLDGRLDFVTSTSVRGDWNLLNLGKEDGDWEPTPLEAVRPLAWVWTVATGDFDADGRADLALSYQNREHDVRRAGVDVLLARADGKWSRVPVMVDERRDLHDVYALATGDFDGDGLLDLVATSRLAETLLFRGDGKGGFEREEEPALAEPKGECKGYAVELRDLDRDGRDEIIATFGSEDCPQLGWLDVWKTEPVSTNHAAN